MADVLNVANKTVLFALPNHSDGEIAFCEEEQCYMIYNDGWQPLEAKVNSDGLQLSIYDLNRQTIAQMVPLNDIEVNKLKEIITKWQEENHIVECLLYGKEIGYFTFLKKDDEITEPLADIIIDCLNFVGHQIIYTYNINDDGSLEFWVDYNGTPTCLVLFEWEVLYFG